MVKSGDNTQLSCVLKVIIIIIFFFFIKLIFYMKVKIVVISRNFTTLLVAGNYHFEFL